MKNDLRNIVLMICLSCGIFLFLTTCETDYVDYDNINCDECYVEKPGLSYLKINFSTNVNDTVWFEVYRGYVDDSMLEWKGWATESPLYLYQTPVDNLYSVKATYLKDGASISVIDADELETHLIKNYCDEDCYIITGGVYNVELEE
ncbi:MAG: hypothetical protein ACQES0_06230 [Bacteroidota bacterium]